MGLFDKYDADPEDLPTFEGLKEGVYEAEITDVEITQDVYKQFEKTGVMAEFITFSYKVEGANYAIKHNFALPTHPQPWSKEEIAYKDVSVYDAERRNLGAIARHLENCGVPRASQKDLSIDDLKNLIGVKGTLTMTKKNNYVNPTKFVIKQESGATLPDMPATTAGW